MSETKRKPRIWKFNGGWLQVGNLSAHSYPPSVARCTSGWVVDIDGKAGKWRALFLYHEAALNYVAAWYRNH